MIIETSAEHRRVQIRTLGCKLNQYDSEMLLTQLRAEGYAETEVAQEADLIVVNTCAVTETAERKGRAAIRAALRQSSGAAIVATGCMAERVPESLLKAGAQKVIGNREKERFLDALADAKAVQVGGIERNEPWSDGTAVRGLDSRTRAFLKVQDGCSQSCTYCIVPRLRGQGRSLPIREAVYRAEKLVDNGIKEIVVTGVALGTYGFDARREDTLPDMVQALSRVHGLKRLRLGSVEPWAVSERLLRTMADSETVCPHLHLPFQSGADEILRRMNRRYTAAQLEKIINRAFELRSDWGIGADVIVGFPGESDQLFERDSRLLTKIANCLLARLSIQRETGNSGNKAP
ncbi:MAG: MiaB/RimO family radical SAM methylthiotransferase [bacterium]|nr:MiaB/RimO family radical SAM methylthiotransferase [bacterium]